MCWRSFPFRLHHNNTPRMKIGAKLKIKLLDVHFVYLISWFLNFRDVRLYLKTDRDVTGLFLKNLLEVHMWSSDRHHLDF